MIINNFTCPNITLFSNTMATMTTIWKTLQLLFILVTMGTSTFIQSSFHVYDSLDSPVNSIAYKRSRTRGKVSETHQSPSSYSYHKTICKPPVGTTNCKYSLNSSLNMVPNILASLLSGSVAGAIGFGIAFPLDTLKTKAQVMVASTALFDASVATTKAAALKKPSSKLDMVQMFQVIYQSEGVSGFFRGVLPMMAGKALIKAVSFSSNSFALCMLQNYPPISESIFVQQYLPASSPLQLVVAAGFAGFASSFTVNPVERIKVIMQASCLYKNNTEVLHCVQEVLRIEGWKGLLGRGLGTTIAREVPSVTVYFVVYELLTGTYLATDILGPNLSAVLFGALSGMACWITVYPIDTVKTILQNSNGHEKQNALSIIASLYRVGGVQAFFSGVTPIMLRAALNHSATFYIYALLMHALSPDGLFL